jgi:hypothetical protein
MKENRKSEEMERRFFPVTEFRAVTDDKGIRHIVGHAAVFNTLSEDMGGWRERILPGAFTRAIKENDVRALWNHNSDIVLGRSKNTKNRTLLLSEDNEGLGTDILPPDTQFVKDMVLTPIDRGDVDKMSFGFMVRVYPDGTRGVRWVVENGEDIRELLDLELFDVSPVTFPAYPDTEVGLRSLEEHRKTASPSNGDGGGGLDPAIMNGLLAAEEEQLRLKINC